jgi:hypothetical protein
MPPRAAQRIVRTPLFETRRRSSRHLLAAVVFVVCTTPRVWAQDEPPVVETTPAAAPAVAPDAVLAPLEVRVGANGLPLLVPRAERLEYHAHLELAGLDIDVGRVTVESSVKPYQAGLFAKKTDGPALETGRVHARAHGEYGVYSMDSNIETLMQPQAWPALVHQFEQKGTERRRREILVGTKDGVGRASFRSDTKNGAPKGTRIWRAPSEFDAPAGALDTLGAAFVVRGMIRDGRDVATLHLLDKDRLWEVVLTLDAPTAVETHAGRFQAREVRIATQRVSTAGVAVDDEESEEFSGPFGLRGHIRMYVERYSGVPLVVMGRIPAGPIDIDIDIRLASFAGTPANFVALVGDAGIDPVAPDAADGVDDGTEEEAGGDTRGDELPPKQDTGSVGPR